MAITQLQLETRNGRREQEGLLEGLDIRIDVNLCYRQTWSGVIAEKCLC